MLLLMCCINVHAKDSLYSRVDVGIAKSNKVKSDNIFYKKSGSKSFKEVFAYSLGLGYKINDNIRSDLTYGGTGDMKYKSNSEDGEIEYRQKVKLQSVMLNLYYDVPVDYVVKPYFGIGAGHSEIKPKNATITNDTRRQTFIFKGQTTHTFSYSIMTGVTFNLCKQLDLDVGYKFQDYGRSKGFKSYEFYVDSNKQQEVGYEGQKKFGVQTHSLAIGLRYTF